MNDSTNMNDSAIMNDSTIVNDRTIMHDSTIMNDSTKIDLFTIMKMNDNKIVNEITIVNDNTIMNDRLTQLNECRKMDNNQHYSHSQPRGRSRSEIRCPSLSQAVWVLCTTLTIWTVTKERKYEIQLNIEECVR